MDHGSHDTGAHDATAHTYTSLDATDSGIRHDELPSYGSLSQPQPYPYEIHHHHYHAGSSHQDHRPSPSIAPQSQHRDPQTPHGRPQAPHKPHHPRDPSESPPPYAIVDVPWVPTPEQRPLLYTEQRRIARRRYAEAVHDAEQPWTSVQCAGLFVWLMVVVIIGFVVYSVYFEGCHDPYDCRLHLLRRFCGYLS
ncbi:hypothetical protein BDV96DRAFT_572316 [Lophiotrema nucula]|uniref:Uncharacterized protein n=1 Tax=Lophiotrema nucula TaxID=690887 RepID=A0A6A5ZBV9_9PLEO|nr:hypothetical protein BDV96DRAFT_572316 [Lophiotrema nucula]